MARMPISELKDVHSNNASHIRRSSGSGLCLLLWYSTDTIVRHAWTLRSFSGTHLHASQGSQLSSQAYLAVLVLYSRPDLFFNVSIVEHHHLRTLNRHKEHSFARYFLSVVWILLSYFFNTYRNTTRLYWNFWFFCGHATQEPLDGKTWFQAHIVELHKCYWMVVESWELVQGNLSCPHSCQVWESDNRDIATACVTTPPIDHAH